MYTKLGLCCILVQIMQDPVVAADGNTYERSGVERWIKEHGAVSMISRAPMPHKMLVPNQVLTPNQSQKLLGIMIARLAVDFRNIVLNLSLRQVSVSLFKHMVPF